MTENGQSKRWPEPQGFNPRDRDLVVDIWNQARTARMSELYYGEKIKSLTPWNFGSEFLLALVSSGSGVAGWTLWNSDRWAWLWAVIASVAALLAIAKPLIALDRTIRRAGQQQQRYRAVLTSLENLALDIQQAGSLTAEHRRRYQRARELLIQAGDADDAAPSIRRLNLLQARVNEEMPAESLWVPTAEPEPGAA